MTLFNVRLKDLSEFVVYPDLTIKKPNTNPFTKIFTGQSQKNHDSAQLFEKLKNSMSGNAAQKLTNQNREILLSNLEVLKDKDLITSNQAIVLNMLAAKLHPKKDS